MTINKDKKWMLMTYYCPTYGDVGRIEPFELRSEEIRRNFSNKINTQNSLTDKDSIKSEKKS